MHMFYGGGGGFGFLSMLLPMVIWLLVVIGIVQLVSRWFRGHNGVERNEYHHPPGGGESALEVLKKRYAAGELTTEEYISMKEEIRRY